MSRRRSSPLRVRLGLIPIALTLATCVGHGLLCAGPDDRPRPGAGQGVESRMPEALRLPGPTGGAHGPRAIASSWMVAPSTCGASARPAAPRTTPSATISSPNWTTTRPTASTRSPSSTWAAGGHTTTPSRRTGRRIDPGHQGRMERIIRACAEREMVVGRRHLLPARPVRPAGRRGGPQRRPHRGHGAEALPQRHHQRRQRAELGRLGRHGGDLRLPGPGSGSSSCCRLVHEVDPDRLVGGGGYDHEKNIAIGRSPEVDALLFDTSGPDPDSGDSSTIASWPAGSWGSRS